MSGLLESWIASYQDPLFWRFPVAASAVSMGAFLLFAVPLTAIAVRRPRWSEPYRIQRRVMQADRVIGPSVRRWLVNNLILFAIVVVAWPLYRESGVHVGPLPVWWVVPLQLALFIVVDDFLYYWMHRAMHSKYLYKYIHSIHHEVSTPWAISAHYMHPVEFVLTGLLMLLMPVLLGVHVLTLYLWIVFRQWEAAEGHCGYSFPWSPSKLLPGYDGVEYHDFHHAKFTGNYAGFLTYLDRWFGAYSPGYERRIAFARANSGKQREDA